MTERNERPPRVLIVENRYDDMEYCVDLLSGVAPGIQLVKIGNGRTALKVVSSQFFDAVFISIDLPDLSGFHLAAAIRSMKGYYFLPLVFMGEDKANRVEVFQRFHCHGYVSKPFQHGEFEKLVRALTKGLYESKMMTDNRKVMIDKILFIEGQGESHLIHFRDILFAEINGRMLTLYTKKKVISGIRMKLAAFIQYVDHPGFLRCHKSFAVNMNNVISIKDVSSRIKSLHFNIDLDWECFLSKTFYEGVYGLINSKQGEDK